MFNYLWFGVVSGAFLLIATLGFALTSRVNKFLNIAHAELMAVSALTTWVLAYRVGMPFIVAAAFGIALSCGVGLLVGRLVYEPMLAKGASILLIVSVGTVYLLQGLTEFIVPPGTMNYQLPQLSAWNLGFVTVTPYEVLIVALAALSFAGLHLFIQKTEAGAAIRAISNDRELAEVRGINVSKATRHVWLISSGLAGLAGVCLGMMGTLTTDLAFKQILLILAVSILAGLGQVYGVAVAALVIGIAMDMSTMIIPSGWRTGVAFLIIILVLVFRPSGLFGRKARVA